MSHCSTNPADLEVVSSVQGRVVSVMVNVVPLAAISAEGVTLDPFQVLLQPQKLDAVLLRL